MLTSQPTEALCRSLAEFIIESILVPDFNEPDLIAQMVKAIERILSVQRPSPYQCYEMECEMKRRPVKTHADARSHVERWRRGFAHRFRKDLLDHSFVDGSPQRIEFTPKRRRSAAPKSATPSG